MADGIYLPKEENSEQIGQFRPISLLNVDGNIYVGVLAKRTVDLLQNNGYINQSVQKAGIPAEIKEIMKRYYGTFKMRFSTETFTTEWHRLEIGIAAGSTISVIWFIAVMEMLLRSANFTEEVAEWLGLPKGINSPALYRKEGSLRMPFTAITEVYKTGKVRTVLMLRESNDSEIRTDPPTVRTGRKWKAEDEVDDIISSLKHRDIVGPVQCGRAGLGSNPFKPFSNMNKRQMGKINQGERPRKPAIKSTIAFIRSNQKDFIKKPQKLMDDATWRGKWQIDVGLPGRERFFPIPTALKPDIVIWSEERTIVYLIELTVPHEDNIDAAQIRKDERYANLLTECEENGWVAKHFPIEVGCRGFIGNRLRDLPHFIGIKQAEMRKVMRKIEETVEKASHWVWLKRNDDTLNGT
ncbi:uncharacterized protein [Clytia hemisphaerica]|uniref:uncharacterized protein n=1 Tax=Clytia hemisphaerica TaxID=252671 RepID=UPI0034D54F33